MLIVGAGKPSLKRKQTWISSGGSVCARGLEKQLCIVQNLMPKHFPHVQKAIYNGYIHPLGCDPAHLQHQHLGTDDGLSFSLGDNNPPSITQVQIPTSPHLPHPSAPLPIQMTVITSFIRQSCLWYRNCSITGAEGCSMREAAPLGVWLSVPHHCSWKSLHQPHTLTWVHTLCCFLLTKKSSQISWDWFFREGERRKQKRWADTRLILTWLLCRLMVR